MDLIVHIKLNGCVVAEDTAAGRPTRQCSINYRLAQFLCSRWDVDDCLAPGLTFEQHLNRHGVGLPDRQLAMVNFCQFLRDTNHKDFGQVQLFHDTLCAHLGSKRVFDCATKLFSLASDSLDKERKVHIVLRSFGCDLPWACYETGHPWVFARFVRGTLHTHTLKELTSPQDMNDYFMQHPFVAVQDDYDWWRAHTFNDRYGMPFPIDQTRQSVFFTTHSESSSVTPIHKKAADKVGEQNSLRSCRHEGQHLVLDVNTLEAMVDADYFIRKLKLWLLCPADDPPICNPLYTQ